jgi:hypothetical protein
VFPTAMCFPVGLAVALPNRTKRSPDSIRLTSKRSAATTHPPPLRRQWSEGRERINIHGAINLESGQTRMIDVQTVDAASTITLLEAIEALYPLMLI